MGIQCTFFNENNIGFRSQGDKEISVHNTGFGRRHWRSLRWTFDIHRSLCSYLQCQCVRRCSRVQSFQILKDAFQIIFENQKNLEIWSYHNHRRLKTAKDSRPAYLPHPLLKALLRAIILIRAYPKVAQTQKSQTKSRRGNWHKANHAVSPHDQNFVQGSFVIAGLATRKAKNFYTHSQRYWE